HGRPGRRQPGAGRPGGAAASGGAERPDRPRAYGRRPRPARGAAAVAWGAGAAVLRAAGGLRQRVGDALPRAPRRADEPGEEPADRLLDGDDRVAAWAGAAAARDGDARPRLAEPADHPGAAGRGGAGQPRRHAAAGPGADLADPAGDVHGADLPAGAGP